MHPPRIAAATLLSACAIATSAGREANQQKVKTVREEAMIPASDSGIQLYVRNKHPEGSDRFAPERILLYVHGATYPAETTFDLSLDGISWMDYIAQRGFDVWLVDLRGYGRSTRPPEMDQPPEANPPLVRTDVAVRDVGAAVEHILQKRGVARLCLMGWSWGTTIMGAYTVAHPGKVEKLVLYAPQWLRTTPGLIAGEGAYRTVSVEATRERWLKGVPDDKKADLIPAGWFDQWADATFATDPVGSQQSPKKLRAPNGVIADGKEYWASGKPYYDPSGITVPTLLVHAEWDQDLPTYMSLAYFERLTGTPYKRFVQIGEGTHTVIMEKNRMQLFREVQLFLEETGRTASR